MIKVKLTKNNNYYKRIIITGHANYDDFGKDIVCAAVSSTVITSVNSCLAIDNESISYEDKNGLDIKVLKDDEVTTKIINVMVTNLYELEKAYPKNIKIKEEKCLKKFILHRNLYRRGIQTKFVIRFQIRYWMLVLRMMKIREWRVKRLQLLDL